MANSTSPQLTPKWPTEAENLNEKNSATVAVNFDTATAKSVELEASAP